MASSCRPTSFPRIDRFIEHNIELPVAEPDGARRRRAGAARALRQCAGPRQGRGAWLADPWMRCTPRCADRRRPYEAGIGRAAHGVLHQARLPGDAAPALPELDPRLFSFNSAHGWCPTASAPA
jgi:excinuclease ABC subunit A